MNDNSYELLLSSKRRLLLLRIYLESLKSSKKFKE